jgi:hypothetical protein
MGKKNILITYFFVLLAILQVIIPAFSVCISNKEKNLNNQIVSLTTDSSFIFDSELIPPSFYFIAEIEEASENEDFKMLPFIVIKLSYAFLGWVKHIVSSVSSPLQYFRGISIFLFISVFRI